MRLIAFWTGLAVSSVGVAFLAAAPAPKTRKNDKDGLKYVWIAPAEFTMGCQGTDCAEHKEVPAHQVRITKGFWVGQTEVTVGAYKKFSKAKGQALPPEPVFRGRNLNPGWSHEDWPIANISWDEAKAYCEWTGGRLPTAAEWEYVARAGTTGPTYGETSLISWNSDNSGKPLDSAKAQKELAGGDGKKMLDVLNGNGNAMHPVGQKQPNAFGLYDTIGNVLEWVSDFQPQELTAGATETDPQGPATGLRRGSRGGSWITAPDRLRVTSQTSGALEYRSNYLGVRCVQN
jgi:sulfatase modifying factor 1